MNMMLAQDMLPAAQAVAGSNVFAHVDLSHALAKMRERTKGVTTLAAKVGEAGVESVGFVWGCIKSLLYRLARMLGVKVVPKDAEGQAEVLSQPGAPVSAAQAAQLMAKQATELLRELSETEKVGDSEEEFVSAYLAKVEIAAQAYQKEKAACDEEVRLLQVGPDGLKKLEAARQYLLNRDEVAAEAVFGKGKNPKDDPLVLALDKQDKLLTEWLAFGNRFMSVKTTLTEADSKRELEKMGRRYHINADAPEERPAIKVAFGPGARKSQEVSVEPLDAAGSTAPDSQAKPAFTIAMGPGALAARAAAADSTKPASELSEPVVAAPSVARVGGGGFKMNDADLPPLSLEDIGVDVEGLSEGLDQGAPGLAPKG